MLRSRSASGQPHFLVRTCRGDGQPPSPEYKGRGNIQTIPIPWLLLPPSGSSPFSGLCYLLCSRDGRWVGLRLAVILPTPNINENACTTSPIYLISRQECMASYPYVFYPCPFYSILSLLGRVVRRPRRAITTWRPLQDEDQIKYPRSPPSTSIRCFRVP